MFDTPPVDIFASQNSTSQVKDDIFASSVKRPLKKPEKSLDELLSGKKRDESDGVDNVRDGKGGRGWGVKVREGREA